MTLRVYLTLLRPVRTILVVGLFTLAAVAATQLLPLRPPVFLVLGIVFPAIVATALSSIIYEPLHRPFAVWLPDIRGRLRNFHTGTSAIVACGNVLALHAFVPDVSIAAACGLIAIPFGHRLVFPLHGPRSRPGLAVLFAAMSGVEYVHAWSVSHPWLPFVTGVGLAGTGLYLGFSRRRVRDLSRSFHLSTQSLLFNLQLVQQHRVRTGKSQTFLASTGFVHLPRIDGSTLSWVRAMWQCSVASPPRMLAMLALLYFALGAGLPALMGGLDQLLHGATLDSASLLQNLIASGRSQGMPRQSMILFVAVPMVTLFAAIQQRVFVRFPISRVRLARTAFASALIQSGVAAGSIYLGVITLVLVLVASQGRRPGFADVRDLVAIALLFAPALAMMMSLRVRLTNLVVRFLVLAVLAGFLAGLIGASLPGVTPLLFSLPGLLVWAAATAGAFAYYRHTVFAHFLNADLATRPSFRPGSLI